MKIKLCATSDIGKERTNNEDAFAFCSDLSKKEWYGNNSDGDVKYVSLGDLGALLVVADGMGGANAGEMASSIAINKIQDYFSHIQIQNSNRSEATLHGMLKSSISEANKSILSYAMSNPDSSGLGSTIVILWLIDNVAHIAWCGDSRCYCFNPNLGLKSITKDHSYVQDLLDRGEINEKEKFNHPDCNVITRCLGDVDVSTEPEIVSYNISSGDVFLLCSDGLCGYCNDKAIEKVMYLYYDDVNKCKDNLLKMALDAGGFDNITIALCETEHDNVPKVKISAKTRFKRYFIRLFG